MSTIADLQLNTQTEPLTVLVHPCPTPSPPTAPKPMRNSTWPKDIPKSGILVVAPSPSTSPSPSTPSPGSSVDDNSLLSCVASSSSHTSTSSSLGGHVQSSSAPCSPGVTFAPLPNIEPRVCRRGPLGVAARASLLRQRPGQNNVQASPPPQQNTVTPNINASVYRPQNRSRQNSSPSSSSPQNSTTYSTGLTSLGGRSTTRGNGLLDEEEDAFAALGKMINDASRTLWRRFSTKRAKSPRNRESTPPSADINTDSSNSLLEAQDRAPSPSPVDDLSPSSSPIPQTTGPTADDSILSSFIPDNMTPRALRRLRLRNRELHMDSAVKYSLKEESGEEDDGSHGYESGGGQSEKNLTREKGKDGKRKKSLRGRARAEDVDPMIRTIREDSDVDIDIGAAYMSTEGVARQQLSEGRPEVDIIDVEGATKSGEVSLEPTAVEIHVADTAALVR